MDKLPMTEDIDYKRYILFHSLNDISVKCSFECINGVNLTMGAIGNEFGKHWIVIGCDDAAWYDTGIETNLTFGSGLKVALPN